MSIKLRDVKTRVIKGRDGSYAIACSALGVYSVGKTLRPQEVTSRRLWSSTCRR